MRISQLKDTLNLARHYKSVIYVKYLIDKTICKLILLRKKYLHNIQTQENTQWSVQQSSRIDGTYIMSISWKVKDVRK